MSENLNVRAPMLFRALRGRFDLIVFDWDGTAVPDRATAVPELIRLMTALLARGVLLAPVTGTSIDNLERQALSAIPHARQGLFVCTNRGSEVYTYDGAGHRVRVYLRVATPEEDSALTRTANAVARRLRDRGLETAVVHDRLNRRKIDLIPLPEWHDPPKARIGELVMATDVRIHHAGFRAMSNVIHLVSSVALSEGLSDARITSDGKYVEVGLTDKSDSIRWIVQHLAQPRGIEGRAILIAGDEFGDVGGFEGSDARMLIPEAGTATYLSVGREPQGVPGGVLHLPGGPDGFLDVLRQQLQLGAAC